jgi:hypothetical protein
MQVSEHYADFTPAFATEKLTQRDGLCVSRETVRSFIVDAGMTPAMLGDRSCPITMQGFGPEVVEDPLDWGATDEWTVEDAKAKVEHHHKAACTEP